MNQAKETTVQPGDGLWAFYEGQFHNTPIPPENKKYDHVTWFREIGLPDYGQAFDRVLRGRLTWDWHAEHYVLSFYGTPILPNRVYSMVNRKMNPNKHRIVEKPASDEWL
ncbi:hypothetical protein [Acanthopleuribacter pedis]|uniref:Uncharacterized protein n=1 Tax=Acanthopleuribacter pedis TaxID=442870 RepID=A0A8J7QDW6_9BACT|nr:hypothetical protein [Acanthopleuribacter pedis]MBO1322024.1 hypothetical protein [Acanthopleuribacter pedis]